MKQRNKKKNIIIVSTVIVFLLIILVSLYGSFAFTNINTSSYNSADKVFKLNIGNVNDNTYSSTISNNDSKDLNIEIKNEENIDLKYVLYYSGIQDTDSVEIVFLNTKDENTNNVISKNDSHSITIRIINHSNIDQDLKIGISFGYINGGDLLVDDNNIIIDKVISDNDNLDKSGANKPKISNNMIPVYYDMYDNSWKKADETNVDKTTMWYNYDDKMWANVLLKDNNKIVDISNNLNNGTNNGATWDKTNGLITTNENNYIDCGLGNYYFGNKISMILRFKFNNLSNSSKSLISNLKDNSGISIAQSIINDKHVLSGNIYLSDYDKEISVSSSESIETNKWYTVALIYNGDEQENNNLNIYINGVLSGSVKTNGAISISANDLIIGGSNITVSDFLIYNRALNDDEVKNNFNNKIDVYDNKNMIMYYNFMDGIDIPNGTAISDKYEDGSLSFFTWIPRYKYRVWNIEKNTSMYSYTDNDGNVYDAYNKGIDIKWENETNSTGNINCRYMINNSSEFMFIDDETNNIDLSEKCIGNNGEYYTHPAFNFNGEKTGFWIGKFETGGTLEKPLVLPDVVSFENNNISNIFSSSLIITNDNLYGINNQNLYSHVLKNTEWGAVAYLTHSIYGLCNGYSCQDIKINNSTDYYTGRSMGLDLNSSELSNNKMGYYTYKGYKIDDKNESVTNTLKINTIASTTGNIYGIYDMAGGRSEYVMGIMSSVNGSVPNLISDLDYKHFDIYSYGNEFSTKNAYNRSRLGDATGEIALTENISNGLWYNHYNNFINGSLNIFIRGGNSNNLENGGLFSFDSTSMYVEDAYGYRIVIS